jgi:hypothetical protein
MRMMKIQFLELYSGEAGGLIVVSKSRRKGSSSGAEIGSLAGSLFKVIFGRAGRSSVQYLVLRVVSPNVALSLFSPVRESIPLLVSRSEKDVASAQFLS